MTIDPITNADRVACRCAAASSRFRNDCEEGLGTVVP